MVQFLWYETVVTQKLIFTTILWEYTKCPNARDDEPLVGRTLCSLHIAPDSTGTNHSPFSELHDARMKRMIFVAHVF